MKGFTHIFDGNSLTLQLIQLLARAEKEAPVPSCNLVLTEKSFIVFIMKNFYYKRVKAVARGVGPLQVFRRHRRQEQVWAHPTTQAHILTSKALSLSLTTTTTAKEAYSSSEDKGKAWKQTEVKDFNYHKFYEADGYGYAWEPVHA